MNYTKYRNRKTVYRGITFDSEAEARRYAELLALSNAGIITNLRRQVKYELVPTQKLIEPKKDCGGRNTLLIMSRILFTRKTARRSSRMSKARQPTNMSSNASSCCMYMGSRLRR